MRYYIRSGTLFLRGHFRAAGTGIPGGLSNVSTIVVHGPPREGEHGDPSRVLEGVVRREGLPPAFFGVFSAEPVSRSCILHYDSLAAFVFPGPGTAPGGGLTLVIYSSEGLSDAALLSALVTAAAAHAAEQYKAGCPGDLPRDTIVVACEGDVVHADASPATVLGSRIAEAVRFGARTLREGGQRGGKERPRFFIYSRYQGDHWAEWVPEECPYYPCHFPGQRCDFCYCPFYPCGDETLGQWVMSGTKNGPVWSCSDCTLLHEPAIADYLLAHPEASLRELKAKKTRERS